MNVWGKTLALAATLLLGTACLIAQSSGLQAQSGLSARARNYRLEEGRGSEIWLNWKPELFAEYYPGAGVRLAGELSADASAHAAFTATTDRQAMEARLYRAWGAASVGGTELKAGLQHIRMGVARIYRPLMWFDHLVPESLLEDSPGVTALTLAHFFPNPELRLWLMPATGKLKGSEILPAQAETWESGVRIGFASSWGDMGFSYHRRRIDPHDGVGALLEQRLGLDHRVDGVVGAWLEAALELRGRRVALPAAGLAEQSLSATLGGDYTLGLGNGLYLMTEQNLQLADLDKVNKDSASLRGALLLSYPLGLLDELRGLASWDFSAERATGSLAWRRTYDLLSWELSFALDSGYPAQASRSPLLALTLNYDL